ncbi:enoyl-CoA hydratase [soil metagenome]
MEIELAVDNGVATLTLAAPQRRNALTPTMARELVAALDRVDADDSVGAVVIRGAGGSFCAGAHTATLLGAASDPAEENTYASLSAIYAAFTRVGTIRPMTIAAVRGPAVGAGLNLALATDLRIVARDARLMSGFQRIGLHPGGGHFVLLSRLAGREAAAAMALCGAEIDGDRAAQLGLAWQSVADEAVEDRAFELAREAAKDPELARATVRTFRLETGPPALGWDVAVQVERAPQMWSMRRH